MLSFGDKVNIVNMLMGGVPSDTIAEMHGITADTINKIETNFPGIMEVVQYKEKTHHLPLKGGLFPNMEHILFAWFCEQINVPNNRQLAEKAKVILGILNETSRTGAHFSGSNNWANAFKNRYNIEVVRRKSTSTTKRTSGASDDNASDSFEVQMDIPMKIGTGLLLDGAESNGAVTEVVEPQTEMLQATTAHDDVQIESVFSLADCSNDFVLDDDVTEDNRDIDFDSTDETHAVVDVVDDKNVDGAANSEEENDTDRRLKSRKRKRPTIIADDSDDECFGPSSEKKSCNGAEMVLVPSKGGGFKSMTLQNYKEDKLNRIFKPVLKYARDSGWTDEDTECLNRLYQKSLKSCGEEKRQFTITDFFRKKK